MKELKEYPISISETVRSRSIVRNFVKPTQLVYYEGLSRLIGAGSEAAAAITTLRTFRKDIEVVAVQAKDSPAAYNSWKNKVIHHAPNKTFAGGFATGKAYHVPYEIYKDGLDDFVLITDDEIYDAIGLALYYTHSLAEGAGASSIMAAYKIREKLKGKKVVLQMSGCNASPEEIKEACKRRTFHTGEP